MVVIDLMDTPILPFDWISDYMRGGDQKPIGANEKARAQTSKDTFTRYHGDNGHDRQA